MDRIGRKGFIGSFRGKFIRYNIFLTGGVEGQRAVCVTVGVPELRDETYFAMFTFKELGEFDWMDKNCVDDLQ